MPEAPSPRGRHRGALVLGALGLLLCWIPWLGLAVSAIGIAVAILARRRGARVGWAAALGLWGLLLGLFFTGVVVVYPPAETTAADRETWDDFEKAFDDDEWPSEAAGEGGGAGGGAAGSGPGGGPGGADEPGATPGR